MAYLFLIFAVAALVMGAYAAAFMVSDIQLSIVATCVVGGLILLGVAYLTALINDLRGRQ